MSIIELFQNIFFKIVDFLKVTIDYLSGPFFDRCKDIVTAPVRNPDMLWMLTPLLITLLLMEFYFGIHKDEELGWNTAVGNSLVLIFVAIDLFRYTYNNKSGLIIEALEAGDIKIVISLLVLILGLLLLFVDFFHFLPKKLAYVLSSPAYINLISLLGIIIVYSNDIPLDLLTLLACILLFLLANVVAQLIYFIVPGYEPPLQKILSVDNTENPKSKK